MNRRLPIYFLIDVSRSMVGNKMASVNEGLQSIISKLRKDPVALETGYVSIITFGTEAHQIVPLTSVLEVQLPTIKAVGWTNLESGLNKLLECMDEEIIPNKIELEQKGDYKPVVVILSDGGQSRGNWHNIIEKVHARFAKCQNVTAFVATGGQYHSYYDELKEIVGSTGYVVALDDFDADAFTKVIDVVSQSVSRSV